MVRGPEECGWVGGMGRACCGEHSRGVAARFCFGVVLGIRPRVAAGSRRLSLVIPPRPGCRSCRRPLLVAVGRGSESSVWAAAARNAPDMNSAQRRRCGSGSRFRRSDLAAARLACPAAAACCQPVTPALSHAVVHRVACNMVYVRSSQALIRVWFVQGRPLPLNMPGGLRLGEESLELLIFSPWSCGHPAAL